MSVLHHKIIQELAAAFILLTRLPLPWGRMSDEPPGLHASVWAFPVVGAFAGSLGAGFYGLGLIIGLPALTSAFLAVGSMILLTGALHEDGLADVADGFGGGGTVERKLEIMRDSRIGAYGMLAIVIAIGVRVSGLSAVTLPYALSALVVAGMLSRLMMVFVMRYMPPARRDGLAYDAGKPPFGSLVSGLALSFIVGSFLVGPFASFGALGVAFAACLIMAWIAKRQIGGMTGDVLGGVQQVTDIAVLLFLVAYWQ